MSKKVRLGILGCGTVGSALVELLSTQGEKIKKRTGIEIEVAKIGVSSIDKQRSNVIPQNVLTQNLEEIVNDEKIDLVVELMGGVEPAKELIITALKNSKPIVTANKELLAKCGTELFQLAEKQEVNIAFEASVAGAVPIVRTVRDFLHGESITRVAGILNGTTNYILSAMSEFGIKYEEALKQAQELGFAESNPEQDVSGKDAAAKIAILSNLVFSEKIELDSIHYEGIQAVDEKDISLAQQLGYVIKLLAIAERFSENLAIRVHPACISSNHQLAKVSGSYNAVFVEGKLLGSLMLYGQGAGGNSTATAVLADILELAQGFNNFIPPITNQQANILSIDELESAYYLRLEVEDNPGVLASVTKIFDSQQISIDALNQIGDKDLATLVFVTHRTLEKNFNAALKELKELKTVISVATSLRVVDI